MADIKWFNLDPEEEKKLLEFLKIEERGSDTIVIQAGSHSIKIGLASQAYPFLIPTVVAHRTKGGRKNYDKKNERDLYENGLEL